MTLDWSDYEPKDAIEVVGVALIAAGITGPEPEGYDGPGVTMDRQTASEIVEALEDHGYVLEPFAPADEPWEAAIEAAYRAWRDCGNTGWAHNGGRPCAMRQHAAAARAVLERSALPAGGGPGR